MGQWGSDECRENSRERGATNHGGTPVWRSLMDDLGFYIIGK
jgi:hypothetical protein